MNCLVGKLPIILLHTPPTDPPGPIIFGKFHHSSVSSYLSLLLFLSSHNINLRMMRKQRILFPKKQVPAQRSEYQFSPCGVVPCKIVEPYQFPLDTIPRKPLLQVKRKHVLKACDHCRVKKTKVVIKIQVIYGLLTFLSLQVRWKPAVLPMRRL